MTGNKILPWSPKIHINFSISVSGFITYRNYPSHFLPESETGCVTGHRESPGTCAVCPQTGHADWASSAPSSPPWTRRRALLLVRTSTTVPSFWPGSPYASLCCTWITDLTCRFFISLVNSNYCQITITVIWKYYCVGDSSVCTSDIVQVLLKSYQVFVAQCSIFFLYYMFVSKWCQS